MLFAVDGFACVRTRGRFDVLEMVRDADGGITSFAADLQQTCDPTGKFLRAQIRINSAVPVRDIRPLATAGRDLVVRSGSNFLLDGLGSASWHDAEPRFRWSQISGTTIELTQEDGRAAFAHAAPLVTGSADAELELAVSDSLGGMSTDRVSVRVQGPDVRTSELDVSLSDAQSNDATGRLFYDVNNAYITAGSNSGYGVSFVSETIFNLDFSLSDVNQIPVGSWKIVDGQSVNAQVFDQFLVRIFETDELNEFRRCDEPDGVLRIPEAGLPGNPPIGIAADFDLVCPGGTRYRGSMRYQSAVPVERRRVFAFAGDDRIAGELGDVTLDGTASISVHDRVTAYRWRQRSGPTVTLRPIEDGIVAFTVPSLSANVDMRFELTVTGGQGQTGKDEVVIHAEDSDAPPPPPPPPGGGGGIGGGGGGSADPAALAAVAMLLIARIRRKGPRSGIMPAACRTVSSAIPRS